MGVGGRGWRSLCDVHGDDHQRLIVRLIKEPANAIKLLRCCSVLCCTVLRCAVRPRAHVSLESAARLHKRNSHYGISYSTLTPSFSFYFFFLIRTIPFILLICYT